MRPRVVTIPSAADDKAATLQAAVELETEPDNIRVKEVSGGQFRAQILNADADLDIEISPDWMSATIIGYAPQVGEGKPLSNNLITRILRDNGILFGIDEEACAELIKKVDASGKIEGIVIAKGKEPVPPKNAKLEPEGDLRYPVFPMMTICNKVAATEGVPGENIKSEEVAIPGAASQGKDLVIEAIEGVEISDDEISAIATTYGLAKIVAGRVSVEPLLDISENNMTLTTTLFLHDSQGEDITIERMQEVLKSLELVHGFDEEVFKQTRQTLLEESVKTNEEEDGEDQPVPSVEGVVLMRGEPEKDGDDARLELFYEKDGGAPKDENARVDLREFNSMRNVKTGQKLASYIPAQVGVPGKTLKGEPIPAKDGKETEFHAGENVNVSDDGTEFTSAIDGVIVFARNILSVTDVVEIKGNVDYSSGNVHIDKGSVNIQGSILSEFMVESPGTILVGEGIESAIVIAGGDVEVKRGIMMQDKGKITACGSVIAHFANNAIIETEGDVQIDNEISNCKIKAEGKVIALNGKGVIMGGTIQAGKGIEAHELGSAMGVKTQIIIDVSSPEHDNLVREKLATLEVISKIRRTIGNEPPKVILERTPLAKRKIMLELIKAQMGHLEKVQKIDQELEKMAQERKASAKAVVNVYKTIHPGVSITIAGVHMQTKKALGRCCLKYDLSTDEIRILPLAEETSEKTA
ncbi:MAG: DUF342 domain-containing protein [Planctomycetes bacterium]|nr:DUF342 domain-containing protein [Planctomycetota bacterium]